MMVGVCLSVACLDVTREWIIIIIIIIIIINYLFLQVTVSFFHALDFSFSIDMCS